MENLDDIVYQLFEHFQVVRQTVWADVWYRTQKPKKQVKPD